MPKTIATAAKKKAPVKPAPKPAAKAKKLEPKAAPKTTAAAKVKASETLAAKRVVEEIWVTDIQPDPNQPRQFPGKDVSDIAGSLIVVDGKAKKNHGINTPLHVRKAPPVAPGKAPWMIIDGERRYWAAKDRGLEAVPCEVFVVSEEEVYAMQLLACVAQQRLTPGELITAIAKLKASKPYRHSTDEDIAFAVGLRGAREVRKYVVLAGLAPEVRKALALDPTLMSKALLVASVPVDDQAEAFKAIAQLDARHASRAIENRYHLRLLPESSNFDPTDGTLPGGPCGKCAKSTAIQRSMWSDGDAKDEARCTDRKCFDVKRSTTAEHKLVAAVKSGAREATDEERKQLFPSEHTTSAQTNEMLDLDTVCDVIEPAEGERRPTWREAIAKGGMAAGELVVRDGHGQVHELLGLDKAAEALAAGGFVKAAETLRAESEIGETVDRSVELRREKESTRLAFVRAGAMAVVEMKSSVSSMKPLDFLRLMAAMFVHANEDEAERVARAMGLEFLDVEEGEEEVGTGWTRALIEWIDAPAKTFGQDGPMREGHLRALILEMAVANAPQEATEALREDDPFMVACERTGVDLRALRATALEESKAPSKPD